MPAPLLPLPPSFLRSLTPAPYFHPLFFLIFQIPPPLGEAIEIYFKGGGVRTIVSFMSYIDYMSYVSFMSYVGYISHVSYMSVL